MSNQAAPRKCSLERWAPSQSIDLLTAIVGKTVAGMCQDCPSESTLHLSPSGEWRMTTTHELTCPSMRLAHRA